MQTVRFSEATGQTIYAFPRGVSLASWSSSRLICTESASPNLGNYTVTLNEVTATEWALFIGVTQPANWDAEIGSISLQSSSSTATVTVQPSIGYGAREVASDVIEIADDATRTIARTVLDANDEPVALPACNFIIEDDTETAIATIAASISGGTYTVVIPRTACEVAGEYSFALRATADTNLDYDSGTLRVIHVANQ